MSDTITPEEIAAKLVGEMDFGDRDLRACISTAIREAEARGAERQAHEENSKGKQAYQMVGALAAATGTFNTAEVERALDYLGFDGNYDDKFSWAAPWPSGQVGVPLDLNATIAAAEARGEAKCLRAITDRTNRHSMDDNLPALHESIECEKAILAVCSRKTIEASEADGMVEGYNGA